jgi:hypothetical protein
MPGLTPGELSRSPRRISGLARFKGKRFVNARESKSVVTAAISPRGEGAGKLLFAFGTQLLSVARGYHAFHEVEGGVGVGAAQAGDVGFATFGEDEFALAR